MNYAEFSDYVVTHLWKMGDSHVIDNLPMVIKTAETELNRKLKIEERDTLHTVSATSTSVPVPADYRSLISLSSPLIGEMEYILPAEFNHYSSRYYGRPLWNKFSIANKNIRLIGNISVDHPVDLEFWYHANVPDFQATDASWLADDYLDVYLYCVLKHTAPFLREDERLSTWGALYTDAFNSAMEENGDRQFAGSPINLKMPVGIR